MSNRKDDPKAMEKMAEWLDAVTETLETSSEVVEKNQKALLDLISVVAHGPSRPGAPLTAFLVGYVSAQQNLPPDEVIAKVSALAKNWPTSD
ncbi:DUF6457 domain-containing protein [Actinomycetaceae bacterium MB13-C1-2]|nr:DUF6457 domain-containing protein [Actinomycetaceae bacterium MB13-C1-2]